MESRYLDQMDDLDPLPRTREDTESHLRSILATVPDGMVVIDEEGRILSFSAAAERMFGYAESQVLGENVMLLMPSPDRERHDGYLRHYMNTGERKIIGIGRLTNARHRDGNTFPIELLIGEARLGERRIFTGFIRDLTERQQTELRLQDLQSELTHVRRVSEISTLATSLAHELNQPLTAIANYSESSMMLLSKLPPSELVDKLNQMLEASTAQVLRAGEIVRRLRDFMSHGKTAYRSENLSRRLRDLRRKMLGPENFSGPAWDILLHLFESYVLQRRDTVGNVCDGTEVPPTTVIRWISRLEQCGMLIVRADHLDNRRRFVELTHHGSDTMARYFSGIAPYLIAA